MVLGKCRKFYFVCKGGILGGELKNLVQEGWDPTLRRDSREKEVEAWSKFFCLASLTRKPQTGKCLMICEWSEWASLWVRWVALGCAGLRWAAGEA